MEDVVNLSIPIKDGSIGLLEDALDRFAMEHELRKDDSQSRALDWSVGKTEHVVTVFYANGSMQDMMQTEVGWIVIRLNYVSGKSHAVVAISSSNPGVCPWCPSIKEFLKTQGIAVD